MNEKARFAAFLASLKNLRENKGAMADLRCALVPARESRAWPYIVKYFSLEHDRERQIGLLVAAAFGMQPENTSDNENMGDVMRRIAQGTDKKNGLTSFAARFMRLLACGTPGELIPFLRGIFNAVQAKGIPLNHEILLNDLYYWGDRVKQRWAAHYYGNQEEESESHE